MKIKKIQSLRNSVCEFQQKLNEKLKQFKCPDNWKLMCNEFMEIVLVNKLDGKTYKIPTVFSEYKMFSDDDIESIISMNEDSGYKYLK
jgi:hypothetical protein